MIPDPLHPAVVHFPIVLAVLLPIIAAAALWAIRSRPVSTRMLWIFPVVAAVALSLSAWAAVATGEAEEDRVEEVVGEAVLHEHEESAERFLVLSLVVAGLAGVGLLGGTVGRAGRLLTLGGSIVLVWAGASVGQLGGELVYRHGAAQPYLDDAPPAASSALHEQDDR